MTDTKARQLFDSYFRQYCEHLGRRLVSDGETVGAYCYASQAKCDSYNSYNRLLEVRRQRLNDDGDRWYTVLSANRYCYTCGAIKPVRFECGLTLYTFTVRTPSRTYEWYIGANSFVCGYIGPVPAHRTLYHQDEQYITYTEEQLDCLGRTRYE